MSKTKRPDILVDGVLREMTIDEFDNYNKLTQSLKVLNEEKLKESRNKEIAVAKLVALGLTESDLKAMGL